MKVNSYELFNYQSFSPTLTEVWATDMEHVNKIEERLPGC